MPPLVPAPAWPQQFTYKVGFALEDAGASQWDAGLVLTAPDFILPCTGDTIAEGRMEAEADFASGSPDLGPTTELADVVQGNLTGWLKPNTSTGTELDDLVAWLLQRTSTGTIAKKRTATLWGDGHELIRRKRLSAVAHQVAIRQPVGRGADGFATFSAECVAYSEDATDKSAEVTVSDATMAYARGATLHANNLVITVGSGTTNYAADITNLELTFDWSIPIDELVRGGTPALADPRITGTANVGISLDFQPGRGAIDSWAEVQAILRASDPWTIDWRSDPATAGTSVLKIVLGRVEFPTNRPVWSGDKSTLVPFSVSGKARASKTGLADTYAVYVDSVQIN